MDHELTAVRHLQDKIASPGTKRTIRHHAEKRSQWGAHLARLVVHTTIDR
jgi:hypothetical protein